MSGFVATGGSTATTSPKLTNDGFFPDFELESVRAALRLDGSVTDERLMPACISAVIETNADLATFKEKHSAYEKLELVPSDQINDESILCHLYRRAVYCNVGAELAERYRAYDTTAAGNQRADDLTPSIDEYRRDSRFAIRDLLKTVRVTVELI